MKHGAVTGLSIGYRKVEFEENDHGGFDLHKIDLREGSVVSQPAEDAARIDSVKLEDFKLETLKDFEEALREAGLSRNAAKMFLGRMKQENQREVDELRSQIEELEQLVKTLGEAGAKRDRLIRLENLIRTT